MKLLLDAHTLIWAVDDPSRLGRGAVAAIENPANDLFLSAATMWEIAIKVGLRKLALSMPYADWMNQAALQIGYATLPITLAHADKLIQLPLHHGDPFDRLLVAQCKVENGQIISTDATLDQYDISRIW